MTSLYVNDVIIGKTYLKTSFLANKKLVLLYLMCIQKLTIAAM